MDSELKNSLVEVVRASTEVLSDDDALAITEICKKAADRAIADVTERYIMESVESSRDS